MNAKNSFGIGFACVFFVLSTHAAQFKFPTQTFTVPDGFEVQLVAGPPLVDRPISADFDDRGRLYVTDSSGATDIHGERMRAVVIRDHAAGFGILRKRRRSGEGR